ncbi:hypothetical protein [Paracoccus aeridis]|uniref:hypothetical protein n=1 Tax=Paracoccus aeridis TaxID=1966466 RepID=UPI0010AB1521|nr:hypothetical protein [Paracoccus aeridis]
MRNSLVTLKQRAQATREAYARGEAPPPRRRHVRTREWREKEDLRLIAERNALQAAQAEQQRKAAEAEAALEAERARLAEQAAEHKAALARERAAVEAAKASSSSLQLKPRPLSR